jgi:hypothetical protein
MVLYENPLPGVPIIEPETPPQSGEEIVGYEVLYANEKMFTKPNPRRMNTAGWVSVVLLFLCFWPASCVPCCTSCSYNQCQRPVYGFKNANRELETHEKNLQEKKE